MGHTEVPPSYHRDLEKLFLANPQVLSQYSCLTPMLTSMLYNPLIR